MKNYNPTRIGPIYSDGFYSDDGRRREFHYLDDSISGTSIFDDLELEPEDRGFCEELLEEENDY